MQNAPTQNGDAAAPTPRPNVAPGVSVNGLISTIRDALRNPTSGICNRYAQEALEKLAAQVLIPAPSAEKSSGELLKEYFLEAQRSQMAFIVYEGALGTLREALRNFEASRKRTAEAFEAYRHQQAKEGKL